MRKHVTTPAIPITLSVASLTCAAVAVITNQIVWGWLGLALAIAAAVLIVWGFAQPLPGEVQHVRSDQGRTQRD